MQRVYNYRVEIGLPKTRINEKNKYKEKVYNT